MPRYRLSVPRQCGVTLVELLVVIAIITVLVSLLIPAVQYVREAARRSQCQSQIRQIGLSLLNYESAYKKFPMGGSSTTELSWHVAVLPYLEQTNLYNEFNFSNGPYLSKGKNDPHGLRRMPIYLCPSGSVEKSLTNSDSVEGQRTFTTHYYGSMGPKGPNGRGGEYKIDRQTPGYGDFGLQGLFGRDIQQAIADVTDGTSQSIGVGELSWKDANVYRTWVRGSNFHTSGSPMTGAKNVNHPINVEYYNNERPGIKNNFNDVSFGSEHAGGTNLLMVDGRVTFTSETIDTIVYKSAASIDGKESEQFPN